MTATKTVITIKSTTTVTFNPGDVPPKMIADLIRKEGDGYSVDGNYGIGDFGGTQTTVVDEVTVA